MKREGRARTLSEAGTAALGAALGERLRAGDVLGLVGPLGAGKTSFVRGLARGLGVSGRDPVVSPTFTLVQEYQGRLVLRHMDAYRLSDAQAFEDVARDALAEGDGVVAVEWADRVREALPEETLWLELRPRSRNVREVLWSTTSQALAEIMIATAGGSDRTRARGAR
jgi:tRNA threonylcarbamoyladenosine biosynthesis protein TsaE